MDLFDGLDLLGRVWKRGATIATMVLVGVLACSPSARLWFVHQAQHKIGDAGQSIVDSITTPTTTARRP